MSEYYAGKGCKCNAWSYSECACDADWTDPRVYELQAENEKLNQERDALLKWQAGGFKYEIERPWKFNGAPEFQKLTFDGKEISVKQLVDLAENMRAQLFKYGVVVRLKEQGE